MPQTPGGCPKRPGRGQLPRPFWGGIARCGVPAPFLAPCVVVSGFPNAWRGGDAAGSSGSPHALGQPVLRATEPRRPRATGRRSSQGHAVTQSSCEGNRSLSVSGRKSSSPPSCRDAPGRPLHKGMLAGLIWGCAPCRPPLTPFFCPCFWGKPPKGCSSASPRPQREQGIAPLSPWALPWPSPSSPIC